MSDSGVWGKRLRCHFCLGYCLFSGVRLITLLAASVSCAISEPAFAQLDLGMLAPVLPRASNTCVFAT